VQDNEIPTWCNPEHLYLQNWQTFVNILVKCSFDILCDTEMKFGWYKNNGELQVGVKCLVKLNPDRNFHAHIQEMSPDKGPVIVFVEELGEK
jgi:hypothetical protein